MTRGWIAPGRGSLAVAAALLLAACASVPQLGPEPALRGPDSVAASRSLPATPGASWPGDRWWTDYADPQLAALIDEALANAPDVAAAAARVRRAAALAQQAGAARLPRIDAEAQTVLDRQSQNNGVPAQFIPDGWKGRGRVAAQAGYDLDLWGRNRAAYSAALSEARAAELDAAEARLVLSTAVAAAYADLAEAFDEREVRDRAQAVRLASRDLIGRRQANGLENRGSLRQADAELAAARAAAIAAEAGVASRRAQLAALVGAGPDRGLAIARPTLSPPPLRPLPEGVTTDLVGRRPDIVAARERVEAAARRIDVARADFFPAIRIDALIGSQSLGLANLVDTSSTIGSVGPAISLPYFRGGALRGRYRAARAEFDLAVATYNGAVIEAYRQVAEAATTARSAQEQLAANRGALDGVEEAYRIAQDRYGAGLTTYLDVLAVEDRLLAARQRLAAAEAAARSGDVALVRALGGGTSAAAQAGRAPLGGAGQVPHG